VTVVGQPHAHRHAQLTPMMTAMADLVPDAASRADGYYVRDPSGVVFDVIERGPAR